jgi:hypothetical protein
MVQYLLKVREEIKKLASGHISHRTALRLEKMALFSLFPKYFWFEVWRVPLPLQLDRKPGQSRASQHSVFNFSPGDKTKSANLDSRGRFRRRRVGLHYGTASAYVFASYLIDTSVAPQ